MLFEYHYEKLYGRRTERIKNQEDYLTVFMKNFKKIVCGVCALVLSLGALVGCGGKTPDTPETLEIYVLDRGYGSAWCNDMIDLFKSQEWVREKYPNLKVVFNHNDNEAFAEGRLNAGAKVNTIDLFFGIQITSFAGGPNGQFLDLTEEVYNRNVPGEDILYKDKMQDSFRVANRYVDVNAADVETYYTTSWAGGMNTIFYNADVLKQFNIKVPNTTKELVAACATIKANEGKDNGKYNRGYSFIQSKDANYWFDVFNVWWAQYEGVQRFTDFWNGIDENRYSTDIFKQKGRMASLEVHRDILSYDLGYLDPKSFSYEYLQSQTALLQGDAVFHMNGDWFENEMRTTSEKLASQGKLNDVHMMRLPVVSALGEKLGITDKQLSLLIDYVDGVISEKPEFTSSTGYSEEKVIAAVTEARSITNGMGNQHNAAIPFYATAKDVAVDFLRFMATDIALESYIRTTGGASLPFDYSVKEKNPALYNELGPMQKDRFDYLENGRYEVVMLPEENSFPLARYGGLTPFVYTDYYYNFRGAENVKSPQKYWDDTLAAWTEGNKFQMALANAGLA